MPDLNIDRGIFNNPEKVGVSKIALENVLNLLKNQANRGLHSGVQLHIARKGQTVLNVAIGEARPGIPMKRDSVLLIFSSSKPWTALAIAQLIEQGKLELEQTVVSIIPEFGNGKETCTIEHILVHEAGFPMFMAPKDTIQSIEDTIKDICNEKAEYIPGTQCGYHRGSSWIILGEIVRLIDGRKIEKYLEEEIFKPLGMTDTTLGMTTERAEMLGDRLALKDIGSDYENWGPFDNLYANVPDRPILPGGAGFSTVTDLGKFYLALWNGGESLDGVRIIKKKTLDLFTATHRMGITDQILSLPKLGDQDLRPDYGYGFFKAKYNGVACSPDTFGHGGLRTCVNFCDPQIDLVVNFNSNTMLNTIPVFNRSKEMNIAIYDACRYRL